MTGPVWLAAILGVVMLAAAGASLARIVIAWRSTRASDYGIDGHNVLMGVSMAGMLIPGLLIVTPGPSTVIWLIVWLLLALWFAVTVIQDATDRRPGHRFMGHHVPHLVMAGAMAYMLAIMNSNGSRTGTASGVAHMSGASGMATGGPLVPWPTLDYAFVIFMLGYAVLVIDRLPAIAIAGADEPRPLAPRLAAAINIAMALTMGYMLVMMFA